MSLYCNVLIFNLDFYILLYIAFIICSSTTSTFRGVQFLFILMPFDFLSSYISSILYVYKLSGNLQPFTCGNILCRRFAELYYYCCSYSLLLFFIHFAYYSTEVSPAILILFFHMLPLSPSTAFTMANYNPSFSPQFVSV